MIIAASVTNASCTSINTVNVSPSVLGGGFVYFIEALTSALVLTRNTTLSVALLVNAFTYLNSIGARVVGKNEIVRRKVHDYLWRLLRH
jgi:hypothetical protein